jgi:anti-anti-sigma factor
MTRSTQIGYHAPFPRGNRVVSRESEAPHLPESEDQEIHIRVVGEATVVDLPRMVRRAAAEKLGSLLAFIMRSKPPRLVLNFSQVEQIESSGIAACLYAYKERRGSNNAVILFGVSPGVMRLFKIARIDELFVFCEDEDGALSVEVTDNP